MQECCFGEVSGKAKDGCVVFKFGWCSIARKDWRFFNPYSMVFRRRCMLTFFSPPWWFGNYRRKVCYIVKVKCSTYITDPFFFLHRYFVLWVRLSIYGLHLSPEPVSCNSKRHTKSHTLCRRCGNRAFHRQHKSACRFLLFCISMS